MPVKWTNRSRPPSSGVMKPKPLSSENHLTVPVPTDTPTLLPQRGPEPRAALDDDRLVAGPDVQNVPGLRVGVQALLNPSVAAPLRRSRRGSPERAPTGASGGPCRSAG